MARINPLTGLPEDENPSGMLESGPLVDPSAQIAGIVPSATPVSEAPTEMAGRGGAYVEAVANKQAQNAAQEAAPAPTGAPVIQIGGPKVDSTTRTHSTEREIVAPKVQAAAERVEKQAEAAGTAASNVAAAEAKANAAQTNYLKEVKNAAQTEAEAKQEAIDATIRGRADAAAELQRKEAEAAQKVKFAQDREESAHAATQRTYWNDKPWFYEALAGIAVAASRRNLRAMGEDPSKSGVAQTIDGLLATDRAKKMQTYMRSKEFLEDAKKLPGKAREAYNLKLADLEAAQGAQLKLAAAEAERLKATADADPEYITTQQQVLNAKAQELGAASQLKYKQQGAEAAQMANPNAKTSDSKTTVDVDEAAQQQAKPKAAPTFRDVQQYQMAVNDAKDMRALADKIESNPGAWKDLQDASIKHTREERGNVKGIGVGSLVRGIESMAPAGAYRFLGATPGGVTIEDKLRDNPLAAGISNDLNEYIVKSAKALDPDSIVRQEEIGQRREQIGVQTNDAKTMARNIRDEAARLEARARAYEQSRDMSGSQASPGDITEQMKTMPLPSSPVSGRGRLSR